MVCQLVRRWCVACSRQQWYTAWFCHADASALHARSPRPSVLQAGTLDTLIERLPGFPDNINRGSDGSFWLALVIPDVPLVRARRVCMHGRAGAFGIHVAAGASSCDQGSLPSAQSAQQAGLACCADRCALAPAAPAAGALCPASPIAAWPAGPAARLADPQEAVGLRGQGEGLLPPVRAHQGPGLHAQQDSELQCLTRSEQLRSNSSFASRPPSTCLASSVQVSPEGEVQQVLMDPDGSRVSRRAQPGLILAVLCTAR